MKITDIQTYLFYAENRNWVYLQVFTDEGLKGVGEATLAGREKPVEAVIHHLKPYLIGKNPFNIEKHWQNLMYGKAWRGGPIFNSAVSGLETALWDIVGQALGTPVYNLLGGRVRDRVRTYANGWSSGLWRRTKVLSPQDYAARAREIVAKGYDALKFDPWAPAGNQAWYTCDSREGRLAVERVAAIREAVGPDVDVLIEVHGRFNVYTAVEYARLMEPYRPFFFEEPVMPENMDLMVEVRRAAHIPIATGERLYTKFDYLRLAELHAADIVQPDLTHAGGILEMKKIAAIMEARSIPVAPHNSSGPVATMAALHLDLSIPNFLIQECFADFTPPWWQEAVKEPIPVVGGYIEAPTKPGLGVEFNEEIVAAHPFQAIPHTVRYEGE